MKTTTIVEKNAAFLGTGVALFSVLLFGMSALTAHAAMISHTLDLGSTGQEVTDLQTYLAGTPAWYPEGLVPGYFGTLTQSGVQKFQTAQNIVSSGTPTSTGYGRVGPLTMNTLNQLMNSGNQSYAGSVPVLSPLMIQTSSNSVTFSWSTNEPTTGQSYWDTTPIRADEATGLHQTPYVSGTLALAPNGMQTYHTVTISNLMPNTIYYYFGRSIDASGDMSVYLESWFKTNSN